MKRMGAGTLLSVTLALLSIGSSSGSGGEVKTWRQESASDFDAGRLTRLVITNEGRVKLSRQVRSLAEVGADQVWTLAPDSKGNLYAVTGGPGLLLRIAADGTVTKLYEQKDAQLFALALAADDTVYVGVSPGGTILRIKPDGKAEPLFATGETYVWALAVDEEGAVHAATGPNGKLFRVASNGEGKVRFQAKQPHLLSLALGASGVAYVGSNAEGLIYRIGADDKPFVAYDAGQADIQTLLLGDDGTLYAGTGTPARPAFPGRSGSAPTLTTGGSLRMRTPGTASDARKTTDDDRKPVAKSSGAGKSSSSASRASGTSPGPSKASPGENSVYRIRPDGAVDEIFREKVLVLSLAIQQGRLLVGTGQEGRIYEVDPASRVRGEIARLEHGQINALARMPDGAVVVGTGSAGKLYVLEDKYAPAGELISDVFDARMQTRWGRSAWDADLPAGSELSVSVRTGNVGKPDETWSAWSDDARALPLGRFFQYKVDFKSPDGAATAMLRDFALFYATVNRAPQVDSVTIPNVAKKPIVSAAAKLKLSWKANDPNGDQLRYLLQMRKEGWPSWVTIGERLTKKEFVWDPGSWAGGVYRVRVTADDKAANRAQEALTSSKTSDAFVLDREAPTVKILVIKQVGKKFEVQSAGADGRTRLTKAAYSLDSKEWIGLFPDDGLFDSREEQITFLTDDVKSGTHVLVVRFSDSAGHIGVADSVVIAKD